MSRKLIFGLLALLSACDTQTPDPAAPAADVQAVAANTWVTRRSLSPWREGMAAGTVGGVIYVIGGLRRDLSSPLARVDAYHVATNAWSSVASLPAARTELNGASVISGKLYVTGGCDRSNRPTRTLFVYDPNADSWSPKADMPRAGCGGIQGVIGGQLYVYLPPIDDGTGPGIAGRLFRYNPATNTWVTRAAPPVDHKSGVGGVLNGRLYLAGGFKRVNCAVNGEPVFCDELHGQVNAYNPASNSWAARASMSGSRSGMAATVLSGKLFLVGGFGSGSELDQPTLEVYDPVANRWTRKEPLPIGTSGGAAATGGSRLLYISGRVVEDNVGHQPFLPGPSEVYAYTP